MRALLALVFLAAAAACGSPAQSQTTHSGRLAAELSVHDAWAAPTPAGVDVSAGYATITNGTGAADHLLSATSPRASRVEVHEMAMDGAVMRMRKVDRLEIGAGQEVRLGPGGLHLMFFGVGEPFAEGQSIPVHLVFETAGAMDVTLPVQRSPIRHAHGN